ncbi:hypothetical protein FGO68_gene1088 [Halteria grandinella]|uniref:DOMON domain-containing protein n=1 Tax=Halteria grandinella TaxID=5974 RepID=A0A8J8SYY2_HALGN|nr:hypothetical protein FGO68_gene1088 [Halteria grandinella]
MKQSKHSSTKMMLLTTALLALLGQSNADIVMQTYTRHVDFTDKYFADYFTYLDEFGTLNLRMTLTLQNYDIASWTSTTGVNGIWLGVGFGQSVMADSDIILCSLRYYGTDADDQFICTDRYANDNARPEVDMDQNVTFVEMSKSYNTNLKRATFTVTFDRPLVANEDTSEDVDLENGYTYPAIWSFGRMSSASILSHTLGSDRGTYQLSLTYLNTGALSGIKHILGAAIMGLVVLMF